MSLGNPVRPIDTDLVFFGEPGRDKVRRPYEFRPRRHLRAAARAPRRRVRAVRAQPRSAGAYADPFLRSFEDWAQFRALSLAIEDLESLAVIGVVERFSRRLPGLVRKIRERATPERDTAEVVLATAHKAKGLEFDQVQLAEDFAPLYREEGQTLRPPAEVPPEEINLLYVAATRVLTVATTCSKSRRFRFASRGLRRVLSAAGLRLYPHLPVTNFDQHDSPQLSQRVVFKRQTMPPLIIPLYRPDAWRQILRPQSFQAGSDPFSLGRPLRFRPQSIGFA